MSVRYKRTEQAAKADKASKWGLIEAIADDAVEAGYPISGIESCLAARDAFEKMRYSHTDSTVKDLCRVAKFDYDSDAKQRKEWRRYGWTIIAMVARAGWSPERAYDLLSHENLTREQIRDALIRGRSGPPERDLDEQWYRWLNAVNKLLVDGAKLAQQSEQRGVVLGGHSELAFTIYRRITERNLDAEIRDLLDSEEVER